MLQKILITIFATLLTIASLQAQNCKAITLKHQPCKGFPDSTGYCMSHRAYNTCGALTSKGKPCHNKISRKGEHCRYHNQGDHAVRIIRTAEENSLTSVVFIQDGKTWALDYLTPKELDSLKLIH